MESNHLYLLSTYLKKWSFGENRFSLNYSFCMNDQYIRNYIDMRIASPVNMMNDFLNHCFHRAKELQSEMNEAIPEAEQGNGTITLVGETEIKMKLSEFLAKIMREFNQNKRTQGRQRMIATRSLDFYYNDFEFEPLDDEIKFYVHLNRGANKMNGDLWTNAVDDLTNALAIRPKDVRANKYMATALKKLNRFKEAMPYIQVYAESENSVESLEELATTYLNLNDFKAATKVFNQLEKSGSNPLVPLFGKALSAYKQGKPYIKYLDKIFEEDPDWLEEKFRKDWDFKLPEYDNTDEGRWNAAIAARYMGFERPFDLTKKAFSDEIPSYFDADKGTIRFIKPELDAYIEIANRYKLGEFDYHTYPEKLTKEELAKALPPKKKRGRKKKTEAVTEE